MPRNQLLKTPQFGIRTMLVATTLVAICLVGWRERARYLREHLFINVVDQATGSLLPRFQYQTSVITSETGEEEIWSPWQDHSVQNALALKVPQYCRLEFRARALDVAGGYSQQEQSILVLPHLSHNATLRLTEGKSFQSFLVDSTTGETICGARIVPAENIEEPSSTVPDVFQSQPYFDTDFETYSDSAGRFVVRNLRTAFAIGAKGYQSRVVRFEKPHENLDRLRNDGIQLEAAVRIHGRLKCSRTGQPITDCEVVYDNRLLRAISNGAWNREAYSIKERSDFNLTAKSDQEGCFKLFSDSDIKKCGVWFSKNGWSEKTIDLSECDDDVILDPSDYELVGTVVDEFGEPVKEFEIKTYDYLTDVKSYRFHCEKGYFRILDDNTIVKFEVHAKNKGVFSRQIQSNWAELQPSELVILPNGFEIAGSVLGRAGSNGVQSNVQIELKRIALPSDTYDGRFSNLAVVASTIVEPTGSFRFNHVANGSYMLATSYFGHVVNTRPIIVEKKDVVVAPIELPPLGRIRGKVRNEDGSDAPFHQTYITDKKGNPQKWFHTNHLGEFEMENVPCGRYGIGPKPRQLVLICGRGWEIDGAVLVEPSQTAEFSSDRFPLFELHGLSPSVWANVSIANHFSVVDFDMFKVVKSTDSFQENAASFQVLSQRQPKDQEAFVLYLAKGNHQQELSLVYRANRNGQANKILFRSRRLQLRCSDVSVPIEKAKPKLEVIATSDDPFSEDTSSNASARQSELYAGRTTTFLLKQNRVVTKVQSTGLQDSTPFHVHDEEPDTAVIHNSRFGWSRISLKQPRDNEPKVHELKLEKGAEVLGRINLAELPLMPEAVRLVDEEGVTLTCPVRDEFKFAFQMIWPGKWRLQLLGYAPFAGEQILAERDLVIEGVDSYELELGASRSLQNN